MGRMSVLVAAAVVSGCGSITAVHLDPSRWKAKEGAEEGMVYYLPKPYLLVAVGPHLSGRRGQKRVDMSLLTPAEQATLNAILAKASAVQGDPTTKMRSLSDTERSTLVASVLKASAKDEQDASGTGSPSSAGADSTSFSVGADQYLMKLVYLPDCDHPMALKVTAGLFGNASVQPQLENGWMLTSLNGKVDNTALLTSLASIIGAVKGAPAPAAGTTDAGTTTQNMVIDSAASSGRPYEARPLPPGLHEIKCVPGVGSTIRLAASAPTR